MHFSSLLTMGFGFYAMASPVEKRAGIRENDLIDGDCRDVTFLMARGSGEGGNMGLTVGPPTCEGLKETLGDDKVACQGIGNGYTASVVDNISTIGTSRAGLAEGTKMVQLASTQCPDTQIVVAGYSQGAALIAGVLSSLDSTLQAKVKGAVLYGYTKNQQNDGTIPDYPPAQTKVFCARTDGVCFGALLVTAGHLGYTRDVDEAVEFLAGTLQTTAA
ncbi:related to Probable cutinase 3 [Ramularia collo-cygni]|uniref:Cutinase n=1 Tax=Ramularia collo-cygni TaxID=112498 RepID=A0A2D3UTS6_9PEZI|nr:related to Probable cutinase 3 [Ramularia collo-cygni]CZT16260.1 related to Probable cutinase 3 [Ramularia collo-cygni]